VVRVRPDGTDLETYTQGTRNIYDVAIDRADAVGSADTGGALWAVKYLLSEAPGWRIR